MLVHDQDNMYVAKLVWVFLSFRIAYHDRDVVNVMEYK